MRKEWNSEEISYLKEHIGFYKVPTIAKNLGRSYESVRVRMTRLGLSHTKSQTGFVTIGELAQLLKVDRNTIKWWVKKHDLPCIKKVTRKSKFFYFIDPPEFWRWAEIHKEKIQFSNIEFQVLLPEPDWVEEERKKEKVNHLVKKRDYKTWTTREDQRLVKLREKGLTFNEIGQRMNRSSTSVSHRYKRILR